jgi:hypothetical protein
MAAVAFHFASLSAQIRFIYIFSELIDVLVTVNAFISAASQDN